MDIKETKLRNRLAKAKGGHKRVLEARLAKLEAKPTIVVEEAPVAKKPARKKRAKKSE
jgi:hypothetical protein